MDSEIQKKIQERANTAGAIARPSGASAGTSHAPHPATGASIARISGVMVGVAELTPMEKESADHIGKLKAANFMAVMSESFMTALRDVAINPSLIEMAANLATDRVLSAFAEAERIFEEDA